MPLEFVLDEHYRGPLWQAVLRHNLNGAYPLEIVRVGDLPDLLLGTRDPELLVWAEQQARILVTEDRRTMPRHLHNHLLVGHHSPGVFMTRIDSRCRELVEYLILATYASEPGEFADVITYIP